MSSYAPVHECLLTLHSAMIPCEVANGRAARTREIRRQFSHALKVEFRAR